MGSEGLVMGSGGSVWGQLVMGSCSTLINSHRSKKGNVCKSKHLDFRAPRAAAEKKSGPGGSEAEVLGFAHISFFGTT